MRRTTLLLVGLLVGLALLTVVAYLGLNQVTRQWFEKDLRLRAELAVVAARQSLSANWREKSDVLAASLRDMSHDERIVGAAACAADGHTLAQSEGYPPELSCNQIISRMREEKVPPGATWLVTAERPEGRVQVSAVAVRLDGKVLGHVLVVHDLAF